MKILPIVVGICLILALAWAILLRARRGSESMRAMRQFRYAHRGLYDKAAGIPENSLSAFSRAVAHGFGVELDVHLLRDGSLAVFHDSDIRRMTGRAVSGGSERGRARRLSAGRDGGDDPAVLRCARAV